jgi:hypothetical protein
MRIFILLGLYLIAVGCGSDHDRSINIDKGTRVEGRVSRENVFEGLAKFYDRSTNRLIEQCYYRNGVKDSMDIFYNQNGSIAVNSSLNMGEQNGNTYIYDSNGILSNINYFFHGLRCGNNVAYANKKISSYRFYSLENALMFHFIYDSVKGKKLGDLVPKVFFYTLVPYSTPDQKDTEPKKVQCFLYTPNPPRFDFKYSLVLVDSLRKVLSVLDTFSKENPWVKFDIDPTIEDNNKKIALKLDIMDSINDEEIGSLRILRP